MRFSSVTTLLAAASIAEAAPSTYGRPPPSAVSYSGSGGQYHAAVFYVNWAIYARKHFITDLPYEKLTKINYAFANVNNITGEVVLSDPWADIQYKYPTDVAVNGTQLYGNFNQLFKLKQKNRNLKVALSVGGWAQRDNFAGPLNTEAGRMKFCTSSLELIADLGLDAFNIDWEYPKNKTDSDNLLSTVKLCRQVYDEYSTKYAQGYHFDIDIASPTGPQHFAHIPVSDLDPYVDTWSLMAFDYQGSGFSNFTGHQSNLYPSLINPKTTDGWVVEENRFRPFNTRQAVQYYKAGVSSPAKIELGMPLYGRSFANVIDLSKAKNGLGQKFNGSGQGTWEAGVLDQKALPLNGSKVYHDKETFSSWSWQPAQKQFITFDTLQMAGWKADYIKEQGLGGAWFWESSGDFAVSDPRSSIATVVQALGGEKTFTVRRNNLFYPKSK